MARRARGGGWGRGRWPGVRGQGWQGCDPGRLAPGAGPWPAGQREEGGRKGRAGCAQGCGHRHGASRAPTFSWDAGRLPRATARRPAHFLQPRAPSVLCFRGSRSPGSHRLGGTCLDKPGVGEPKPRRGDQHTLGCAGNPVAPCSSGVLQAGPISPLGTRQRQGQRGSPSQFAGRSPSCYPLSWWGAGAGAGGGCPGRERLGVSHAGLREALPLLLGSLVIPLFR